MKQPDNPRVKLAVYKSNGEFVGFRADFIWHTDKERFKPYSLEALTGDPLKNLLFLLNDSRTKENYRKHFSDNFKIIAQSIENNSNLRKFNFYINEKGDYEFKEGEI